ncbi:hypothetical protein T07_8631 [Trichinella nelsoni]|uniref:Uncharacterized protein n=1 Tax=Trichinella nelsoni TaxID=6336 RepID=A0A0V0SPF4_9BILA|nr:hypothetical protein T07_8631 [Trichinella nelsoni]
MFALPSLLSCELFLHDPGLVWQWKATWKIWGEEERKLRANVLISWCEVPSVIQHSVEVCSLIRFQTTVQDSDIHWPKKEKNRNKETAHCAVSIVDSWSYSNDNDTAYCSLNEPTIRPFARTSLPIWKLAFLSTPLTGALHCSKLFEIDCSTPCTFGAV